MELPQELRSLVKKSVAILGKVLRHELGESKYHFIENLRVGMTELREATAALAFQKLQLHLEELEKLNGKERYEVAHAFTLMLELMNACENAYRDHRLGTREEPAPLSGEKPEAIIYVLTAHPTEARSPQNIAVFHRIQNLLTRVLDRHVRHASIGDFQFLAAESDELLNLLELAWRILVVRRRSPKVKDEAEHLYSLLFRDNVLLRMIGRDVPFYVRSWVGGDKDGHPGVNAATLLESLKLSRKALLKIINFELAQVRVELELIPAKDLLGKIRTLEAQLRALRQLRSSDAHAVAKFRHGFEQFRARYKATIGTTHPILRRLSRLNRSFPGLVVPLELRESSDMLMTPLAKRTSLAIFKMLLCIEKISRGGDPRWYARGFIISMTENIEHIRAAAWYQKKVFRALRLPIIPLFEEAVSLADSDQIVSRMVHDKEIKNAARKYWDGLLEIMVGYSDSSKEAGVLASRLAISTALPRLEKIIEAASLKPVFFHGSGGSIDRGGGSIEDQTAWWPKSALRNYKVTIQGEMVERSLASPAIAKGQFDNIVVNVSKGLAKANAKVNVNADLKAFADAISARYESTIVSADFLKVVEAATPYSYLSALKIGSRPSKRNQELTVKGLRAIPWVLCWTQTRVLFQTWWGVGSAWKTLSHADRESLQKAFRDIPVFTSYIKALGFTLAKVDLNIWRLYLVDSGHDSAFAEFASEFALTLQAYREICGKKDLLWFRPWLGESIVLRSAMIHPLNLLQILAKREHDLSLLRLTVTGISSGMMTTG